MNDVKVEPLKPTELQQTITDLERRIEHLQDFNRRCSEAVRKAEKSLMFVVQKYESIDRLYDTLYEKACDFVYSCDEHRKENETALREYLD